MKGKNLTQLSKVPLENHFFNEAINAQRKHIFEDLLGWMRQVAKIEFQMRGHPHIHEADWVPNGHDIWKLFKNDGRNVEDIRDELDKLHKLYNRFISRMNYLTLQMDQESNDDNQMNHDNPDSPIEDNLPKEWYKRVFLEKNQTLPKCEDKDDKRYENFTILQLLKVAKSLFDSNNTDYKELFDIINYRLTDNDNSVVRHNTCSEFKCLKRKDGSICQNCKYKFPLEARSDSKVSMKFYDHVMILAELISPSNDVYMNGHSLLQSMMLESNNDMKGVVSISAVAEYITKYITKAESKDDMTLLLKEKMIDYQKYEDADNLKSDLSKFMGLVLKQSKKDVSYHHAIWKLQNFEFMKFSDKFPKLNLYKVIDVNKDYLEDEELDKRWLI